MNRLRNILCAVFGLMLLGIYYRFPIGHLSSQQSGWLVLKIMVIVFTVALAFEWLSATATRPVKRFRAPKTGYADPAASA